MGISYSGIVCYGLLYNEGVDFYDGTWPDSTIKVLGRAKDGEPKEFDDWLAEYFQLPDECINWYKPEDNEGNTARLHKRWKLLTDHSQEVFGAEFDVRWVGAYEYTYPIVYVKGAYASCEVVGVMPVWTSEQIEAWHIACEKLRAVLPGSGPPQLYFGCSVG